ncbi:hypothetical protein [Parasphingorhabdus sp.]|uniref:hypothetical protein n=1 Tax=Parasphingorhabdus sp. TaxID=2709688 RepID=UPI003A9021F1
MEFTYKEIHDILSHKHNIASASLTAFRGRIKHMQRLGFPSGVNTGKGRPACYTWRELLLIGLAFEYLEIGSTPDRSIAEIIKIENMLLDGLARVVLAAEQADEIEHGNHFLFAELSALLTLRAEDRWHQQCKILSFGDIQQILSAEGNDAYHSPYAIIDLRQFLGGMFSSILAVCGLNNQIVAQDIKLWASRQLSNAL